MWHRKHELTTKMHRRFDIKTLWNHKTYRTKPLQRKYKHAYHGDAALRGLQRIERSSTLQRDVDNQRSLWRWAMANLSVSNLSSRHGDGPRASIAVLRGHRGNPWSSLQPKKWSPAHTEITQLLFLLCFFWMSRERRQQAAELVAHWNAIWNEMKYWLELT